jgi:hypothetical protein
MESNLKKPTEAIGASTMGRSKTRYLLKISIGLVLSLIFITTAGATSLSIAIGTNSSTWSVHRQSENLIFDYSQSVQGTVSPVDYGGRSLSPYYSGYQDVFVNDVRLRDRTSALQGSYSSEEQMSLQSDTTEATLINITAEGGLYTFQIQEEWPVILKSSKTMKYSGVEINDREFAGNSQDFAGSNLLYNKELSKETNVGMLLRNMNATVLATNDAILSANFMPNREMYYDTRTYTTGIAEMKYRQTSSNYDFKRETYTVLGEGVERYSGIYNITRSIHMKSDFPYNEQEDDWQTCIISSGYDLFLHEGRGPEVSPKDVFDCTCYMYPAEDKIAKTDS